MYYIIPDKGNECVISSVQLHSWVVPPPQHTRFSACCRQKKGQSIKFKWGGWGLIVKILDQKWHLYSWTHVTSIARAAFSVNVSCSIYTNIYSFNNGFSEKVRIKCCKKKRDLSIYTCALIIGQLVCLFILISEKLKRWLCWELEKYFKLCFTFYHCSGIQIPFTYERHNTY